MKLYAIIVTYNAMPWIDRCLQSCGNYPVVVVDNASSDQTVAHIQTNYPQVTLLPQVKNLGFGQGNNVGISYALNNGSEHVLLLNQDAYLVGDCLEILLNHQQQNPQYGILSPVHLTGKGDALDYNFKNFIKRSKYSIIDDLFLKRDKGATIFDIDFVNAACWLISKDCLKKVGGFNPYFFQYGEDRDYVNRVFYHKFKVGIVSSVFVHHDREQRDSKKKNQIMEKLLIEVGLLNMNLNVSVEKYISKLNKKAIKSLLKFDFKEFKKNKELYRYFSMKKKEILKFKSLISSQKEYLFLD